MSARQRARITKQNNDLDLAYVSEGSESSEEENSKPIKTTRTFQFESSSASENESDTNDHVDTEDEIVSKETKQDTSLSPKRNIQPKKFDSYDELEYLQSLIEENVVLEKEKETSMEYQLFKIDDIKVLDVSVVLRRRQGQQAMFHDGVGNNNRNRLQPGMNRNPRGLGRSGLSVKKVLFGAPSEDWPRPPSFVAGGLGMCRENNSTTRGGSAGGTSGARTNTVTSSVSTNNTLFSFEWSPEFHFLHSQYQYIQSSGDANLLVMFLAHFPYHPHALLQLSYIYAGMGQNEKCIDLVKRALYVLECSCMEAFKPNGVLTSHLSIKDENTVYYEVLRRHLQLCSKQGCSGVAMEVCRYIVSLDVSDSVYKLLLVLDHYIVVAGRHDLMLAYCGLSGTSVNTASSTGVYGANTTTDTTLHNNADTNIGTDAIDSNSDTATTATSTTCGVRSALDFTFTSPYRFDYHSATNTTTDTPNTSTSTSVPSLQHLPNWWFSLALSSYHTQRHTTTNTTTNNNNTSTTKNSTNTTNTTYTTTLPNATTQLKAALLRWPFMLHTLLQKIGVDVSISSISMSGVVGLMAGTSSNTSGSSVATQWRRVLSHSVFRNAVNRIPVPLRGYLLKCSEVYALRSAPLWTKEEELRWLLTCCMELCTEIYDTSSSNSGNIEGGGGSMGNGGVCGNSGSDAYNDTTQYTLQQYIQSQHKHYTQLLSITQNNTYVTQYAHARINEYKDVVPRFPDDVIPIDPSLDDLQYVLSGTVRFQQFMDSEGRFLFPVPEPYISTIKNTTTNNTGNNGNVFNMFGINTRLDAPNIDLQLPLMQLFLATFFPWIYIPPLVRH